MNTRIFKLLVLLLSINFGMQSQTEYKLSENAEMKIDGSSTVSDWAVEVQEATGSFTLVNEVKMEVGASLYSTLEFSFPVEKMESGRGPIMNSKIKKALLSEANPSVTYTSTENKIISVDGNNFILESKGIISAAGVEKPFEVSFDCIFDAEMNTISFEGNKDLTLSMFDIVKPTAFFGKLQTKDELNVKFKVSFTK
ncbi:YceI family protein [Seonamhaeicola maritimus]|uniref:Lipid/polyisoprenoid-binding YceI-like domain-containing protein n=1 Tax=Seonamhaeicola maritimus TaxID=2591822 RepID=A0A5C7GF37_9FLAO|nr:YceI family protein [Seonamhaeicola maritimus]TXG35206.1 hypothetical protein FUA22_15755 [Seonamhaeicola maritimus]